MKGIYELTVYADDLTGVDGHNVSDTGAVTVMSDTNTAPVVVSFDASDADPYTGQEITFTGVATDADGDPLWFTFAFGDGTYAVEENAVTLPDEEVSFTVSHTYDTARDGQGLRLCLGPPGQHQLIGRIDHGRRERGSVGA